MVAAQLRRYQTVASIAKETTWGTAVATTDVLPILDIRENNQADVIRDQGLRGTATRDYGASHGSRFAEFSMNGLVYPAQIGYPLMSMFGADTKTGAGPYVHTFAQAAVPPSYTLEAQLATGANLTLQHPGFRGTKLTFTFEAATGAVAWAWDGISITGVVATGTNPALPTYDPMFPGWQGTIVSGTGGLANRLISAEINLIREGAPVHTVRANQEPYQINVGPLGVEGKLVLYISDLADYTLWKNATTTSLVISFTYGSAGTLRTLTFTITSAFLGNGPVEIDRSGLGVTLGLSFLGIYNATDVGPAAVALTNQVAVAY